jgi:hypothetical protein
VAAGWLPALLAILGLGFGAFDALWVRPAMKMFAATGRPIEGTAISTGAAVKGVPPRHHHIAISVEDPELGWQVVDGSGGEASGASVALLCSTLAGRCERRARVAGYTERWPLTTGMGRAAFLLALAAVASFMTRSGLSPDD